MGTNFYWLPIDPPMPAEIVFADGERRQPPEGRHIGKRSAAGKFCWDCGISLCVDLYPDGSPACHNSRSEWHKVCPKCGAEPGAGSLDRGPAAVELGFAKPESERPKGCGHTSSFRWATDAVEVRAICERLGDRACVSDEYGRHFTGREFLRMLVSNCGIEFFDSIGTSFS